MTTAFVLSGGGSLGAVQVGMLQALAARGVSPDLLVGTSAGAMNAAWVAGHGMSEESLSALASVWTGLRRRDVFPLRAGHVLRGLVGGGTGVVPPGRLRDLIEAQTAIECFEDAVVPLHVIAADLLTGETVVLSSGPVVTAVLASAAVPGMFPPVEVHGRYLVDGGVAQRAGVAEAVALGASEVYVLPAGTSCALPGPPRSAMGVSLQALTLLIQRRLVNEVAALSAERAIRVFPPLCPLAVSAADFRHAAELVARARTATTEWLEHGGTELPAQERFLSLHDHHRGPASSGPPDRHPPHRVARSRR